MTEETPPSAAPKEESIPFGKLPASLRKLLEATPSKEWYKIKAIRARYEESVELCQLIPIVDYLLDVAPFKCIGLLRQRLITPQTIDDAFRRIRDALNGVKDACRHVAKLAEIEIRAWKEEEADRDDVPPPVAEAS